MGNANLQRLDKYGKRVRAHAAERLPGALFSQLSAVKRKLWWKYPAWRKVKVADDMGNRVLMEQIDREGTMLDIQGKTLPAPRLVTPEECARLYELVKERKPKLSLEVGMARGFSTLSILQGLADAKSGMLLCLDPLQFNDFNGAALMNVRRAGLDGFLLWWEKASEYALPQLAEGKARFDFAFIDGNHMFDATLIECFYLDRLLTQGSPMVFHDYQMPQVRACVNFVKNNLPYEQVAVPEKNLCVLRKVGKDSRPWFYFKPFEVPQIEWTSLENRQLCD
jgi:predicted O-methyltransferase YrrM